MRGFRVKGLGFRVHALSPEQIDLLQLTMKPGRQLKL